MTATTADQITRERGGTTAELWTDFSLLWTQYQSWQEHDRLLSESQDRLNMAAPEMQDDLKRLVGDNADLEAAGQQLRAALESLSVELKDRQHDLNTEQTKEFGQIKMRLERERGLRGLSQSRDNERER